MPDSDEPIVVLNPLDRHPAGEYVVTIRIPSSPLWDPKWVPYNLTSAFGANVAWYKGSIDVQFERAEGT